MKTYTVTHIETDALNGYSSREVENHIKGNNINEAVDKFINELPDNNNLVTKYEDDTQVLLFLETENLDEDGNVLTVYDITEIEYVTEKEYSELLDDGTIRAIDHYYEIELKEVKTD